MEKMVLQDIPLSRSSTLVRVSYLARPISAYPITHRAPRIWHASDNTRCPNYPATRQGPLARPWEHFQHAPVAAPCLALSPHPVYRLGPFAGTTTNAATSISVSRCKSQTLRPSSAIDKYSSLKTWKSRSLFFVIYSSIYCTDYYAEIGNVQYLIIKFIKFENYYFYTYL